MRVRPMLKAIIYIGFVAGGTGLLIGAAPLHTEYIVGSTSVPSDVNAAVTATHRTKITMSSCSTSGGVVISPDCEVWITMSTHDTASVEFFANNDTNISYTVGVSSDCDGSYFSHCESSPLSAFLEANGGGADFVFTMISQGVTGTQDVHVRFDATSGGGNVIATIHVTIQ
jgi:hypothetical protein